MGDVDILLPEYSNSKYISVKADVVEYDGARGDQRPTYDLILGVNTMRELGIVLYIIRIYTYIIVELLLEKIDNCTAGAGRSWLVDS